MRKRIKKTDKHLSIDNGNTEDMYRKGIAAEKSGDYSLAYSQFSKLVTCENVDASISLYAGYFFLNTGQPWKAQKLFKNLYRMHGNNHDVIDGYARSLFEVGAYRESSRILRKLHKESGDNNIYLRMIMTTAMMKHYREAVKLMNGQGNLYQSVIEQLHSINALEQASMIARQATKLWPSMANVWNHLGIIEGDLLNFKKADKAFSKAVKISPNDKNVLFNLANAHASRGETKSAITYYRRALSQNPTNIDVLRNLGKCLLYQGDEIELQTLKQLSANKDVTGLDRIAVLSSLGKAYDDIGSYQEAFACYQKSGEIKSTMRQYSVDDEIALLARIRTLFDTVPVDMQTANERKSVKPVFIVGLPRSGTTLVEQILAAHPKISGLGELSYLRDTVLKFIDGRQGRRTQPRWEFLENNQHPNEQAITEIAKAYLIQLVKHAPNAQRIIDKQPMNDRYLGFAACAFPNAVFIHCVRDLRDTCVSCLSKNFDAEIGFTDSIDAVVRYARAQREHMAFWENKFPGRIHTVVYENVIDDLEQQARGLVDAVGLDWSDKCLAYQDNKNEVKTASAQQVRQDIYKSSMKRWERYLPAIQPLVDALEGI